MIHCSTRNAFEQTPSYYSLVIGEQVSSLVPKDLQNELKKECNALIQNKQKLNYRNPELTNRHGMRYIKIQDLIEPCNATMDSIKQMEAREIAKKEKEELMKNLYGNPYVRADLRGMPQWPNGMNPFNPTKPTSDDLFLMIPTVFELNKEKNSFQLRGEINDLPKEKYAKLYTTIEKIFNCMERNIRKSVTIFPHRIKKETGDVLPDAQAIIKIEKRNEIYSKLTEEEKKQFHVPTDKYYVYIKLTDYQFMHQTESYYVGGNWHKEGFEQEHIKGVALYYFDYSENIEGGSLTFKDPNSSPFESSTLAGVKIKDNDCVFFTNDQPFKHKVEQMSICGDKAKALYKTKDNETVFASRKLLGMFIVDPFKINKVKSSLDVMVNFEDKVPMIVCRWMKEYEVREDNDILNLVRIFVCGDMEFIKQMTDENRRQKYEFGQKMFAYDEAVALNEAGANYMHFNPFASQLDLLGQFGPCND